MASIRLKPNSKYFIACFTGKDGAQQQKSTKTTDKKLAQKIADAWEEPYRNRCTISHIRKGFNNIAGEIGSKLNLSISVREYFQRWLLEIKGEQCRGTYIRYQQIVRDCLVALGSAADLPLDEMEREHFLQLRAAIAERTSPANANIYLKLLKRIWRAIIDDDLCERNPIRKIKSLNEDDPERATRRPFTDEELCRLKVVLTEEWHLIVHFGEHTGQRLGDITYCTWGQLDLDAKIWEFKSQKTGRDMRVPLTPSLLTAIRKLPKGTLGDPLFPAAYQAKREMDGESRALSARFRQFLEKSELVPKRSKKNTGRGHGRRRRTSNLSFHSLRHNANSNLKKAGVPDAVVQDIIGHESKLISVKYTHIDDATKVAAVAKIDVRPNTNLEAAQ